MYSGSVTLTDYLSLYGGYDPTFTTRDPEAYPTVIDAGGTGDGVTCVSNDHMVIDGFEIRNSGPASYGIQIKNSDIAVRGCNIHDCWRGIGIIYGTGTITDKNAVIEYCEVYDNSGAGIFINDADNPLVQIAYTAVHDNGADGIYSSISSVDILNCTVATNASNDGIELNGGSATIKNCIVAGNGGYGILCSSVTPTIDYNDVWSNTSGGYSGCSAGAHDMSEDPIFCDAGSGNVSVHASSPTLGVGEGGVNMGALGIGCPEGPQDLVVTQNGASLELSWSVPPAARVDVDYYVVYRDTAQVPLTVIATVDAPTTSFTDITVPPCETPQLLGVGRRYRRARRGAVEQSGGRSVLRRSGRPCRGVQRGRERALVGRGRGPDRLLRHRARERAGRPGLGGLGRRPPRPPTST